MTLAEFEILCSAEVRWAVDENIARDPVSIALDKRIEHASLVATQVKRLQRAKSKLPSYYAVRAILPPRAYEQSSSELCAAENSLAGDSVLDLTCGLGVDTLALSRKFNRVVSCERDEVLAAITRYNLSLLGVDNVTIENCSAEEYLAKTTDHFDWIFVDPDRRGENGEKLVLLEECSPNVVELFPRILEVADALCIKSSPLFDTAEAMRKFEHCSVEVVSLGGECKEVNIYVGDTTPTLSAVAVGQGRFEIEQSRVAEADFALPPTSFDGYNYLIIPDVALVHSRLSAAAFDGKADIWSANGVALSADMPNNVLGRIFEIEKIYDFGSKELKRALKGKRVEIFRRDFPLSNSEICKKFSVKEGAAERWCFTQIGGKRLSIKIK
jgi:hypothetical protein